VERRLAAILAADAVGYSRMMGEDEPGTLALLQKHRSEVIDPAIAKHCGRTVKLMGDGLLAEFSSVVEGVNCAAEIQRAMAARNAGPQGPRQMAFRIGVHLGDIIVEGDDLYGDGVNIAARLKELRSAAVFAFRVKPTIKCRRNLPSAIALWGLNILRTCLNRSKLLPSRATDWR
jgi:adenylate cyclase